MTGHQAVGGDRWFRFVIDNSLPLILGSLAALVWANASHLNHSDSYTHFVHFDFASLFHGAAAESESGHAGHHGFTLHFLINDLLMALFFAIAAKEVWESLLPGGALSNPKRAVTPLLATLGGIFGPALIYIAGTYLSGTHEMLGKGWAIPCATDIAFSYLIARMIFGNGHPAIAFLLLLAIADDAAGLMILAVFYPQAAIEPRWLLLTLAAMLVAMVMRRRLQLHSHWWYLVGPGTLSWISFYMANIHPALGLVPIIPLLPHAHTNIGKAARLEPNRSDTLNEFEHFWKAPVEGILGLFGLVNAGVIFSSLGVGTYLVLAGLLVGKPLGVVLLTWFAEKILKLEKPAGMDYRHVATVGMVAGIGFTVALFVSIAAFRDPGSVQDSVKMGALLSFAAAPLALLMGRVLRIRPLEAGQSLHEAELALAGEHGISAGLTGEPSPQALKQAALNT
ncbi:Na+/H+ antiporter NhaA [Candidatus Laterigemmans baculatus]|uniref:Na+/H+ antiporter NhaA n=1 Tax=Candidatus Laterigemmans baculatus TaxID=2770505 RepID=UPI0013D96A27|nr:Na+/H+ antiporter NhaA [Candidatus Laterigemmans baculatus]